MINQRRQDINKPIGHGERNSSKPYYHVVDLPKMPKGANSVTIFWQISFVSRLKLLFSGKLQTSFTDYSVPNMRIDV